MTPQIYAGLPPIVRTTYLNVIRHPIINAICIYTDQSAIQVKSSSRKDPLVECRILIAYSLRKHTKLTLKQIAKETGRSDHTSVIYMLEQYEIRYKLEKAFRTKADAIASIITGNGDNIDYQ